MGIIAVFDGFGELLTCIKADTKEQLTLAINEFADEWHEGCRLQEEITERDWETITNVFDVSFISVVCDVSNGYELELKGVNYRDYTHTAP